MKEKTKEKIEDCVAKAGVCFLTVIAAILGIIAIIATIALISDLFNAPDYNYAIIRTQNGEIIEGDIESLSNKREKYEIKIDGVTYFVNSENCTLMEKEGK